VIAGTTLAVAALWRAAWSRLPVAETGVLVVPGRLLWGCTGPTIGDARADNKDEEI
jgi:hypothetical protein